MENTQLWNRYQQGLDYKSKIKLLPTANKNERFYSGNQWQGVQAKDMPKDLEVGTIAGTSPIGMGRLIGRLEHPHDGTVSVKETHVPFAKDHIVLITIG